MWNEISAQNPLLGLRSAETCAESQQCEALPSSEGPS